jgi:hypothetical protein
MHKPELSDEQKLDEQLAAFTDQVLSKDEVVEMMEDSSQQDEFIKLQKAVLRMKSATRQAYPGVDIRERIRNHLLAEWEADKKSKFSGLKDWFGLQKFPAISLAGGFVVVLVLGFLLIFWPSPKDIPLGAAAGGGPASLMPLFIFIGVSVVAFILWFRHKR